MGLGFSPYWIRSSKAQLQAVMSFIPKGVSVSPTSPKKSLIPLAERMRPVNLDEVVGQERLVGPGSVLRQTLMSGRIHSMVLWGPPGCGKTTLARLFAQYVNADFQSLSAIMSGIADVRKALAKAREKFEQGQQTILFVDEVHRFNKAQQDAFLPDIESGAIVFVGATTENPSFELNSALLSRCRVHVLDAVSPESIRKVLDRATGDRIRGLGDRPMSIPPSILNTMAQAADGDVRRALTFLEVAVDMAGEGEINEDILARVLADRTRRFDKGGDQFYDQISALHKSVRSSDPDGALYWIGRMFDGGVDPIYLARRLTRMAVEDIGLADPSAHQVAVSAWDTYERLGSPEGDLALAQVAVYLSLAPKSNALYAGYNQVREEIRQTGTLPVPLHLRNAPTQLLGQLGHGQGYQYDHDTEQGVALSQHLLPDELRGQQYYHPTLRGREGEYKKKLDQLRHDRAKARSK